LHYMGLSARIYRVVGLHIFIVNLGICKEVQNNGKMCSMWKGSSLWK